MDSFLDQYYNIDYINDTKEIKLWNEIDKKLLKRAIIIIINNSKTELVKNIDEMIQYIILHKDISYEYEREEDIARIFYGNDKKYDDMLNKLFNKIYTSTSIMGCKFLKLIKNKEVIDIDYELDDKQITDTKNMLLISKSFLILTNLSNKYKTSILKLYEIVSSQLEKN